MYTQKINTNSRIRQPHQYPVVGIIVHSMGQYIGDVHASDFLSEIGLSAHYLVEPNGDVIQCVDPERVAYHAGVSRWKEHSGLNSNFLGIELLIEGEHDWSSFVRLMRGNVDPYKTGTIHSTSEIMH
jgi:N-acetyl-anhydromuramyl-L-alanine amidase AmpD